MELRVFRTDTARYHLEDIFLYYKDKAIIKSFTGKKIIISKSQLNKKK
jgi:hypothetical protein